MSTEISLFTTAGLPRLRVATGGDTPGISPARKISRQVVRHGRMVRRRVEYGTSRRAGRAATVTGTAADVRVAPWLSRATAVSEYEPAATFVHEKVYGLLVSVPSSVEPAKNCTCDTLPSASLALAVMAIVAGAVNGAPEAGAVIATDGGWFEVGGRSDRDIAEGSPSSAFPGGARDGEPDVERRRHRDRLRSDDRPGRAVCRFGGRERRADPADDPEPSRRGRSASRGELLLLAAGNNPSCETRRPRVPDSKAYAWREDPPSAPRASSRRRSPTGRSPAGCPPGPRFLRHPRASDRRNGTHPPCPRCPLPSPRTVTELKTERGAARDRATVPMSSFSHGTRLDAP